MRDARRRSPSRGPEAGAWVELAPELTPRERAAALSRLGRPAPSGVPLEAGRLDAARDRLRAAAALPPPATDPSAAAPVDPGAFDAARQRLRKGRSGRRTG